MTPDNENEFSLALVIASMWRHRIGVGLTALVFAILAGVWAFTTKPYFKADAVVVSALQSGLNQQSLFSSEIGGLATLAGVDLSANGGPSQQAAAVLESHYLIEDFVKLNNLIPVLIPHPSPSHPPTLWQAVKDFKEKVLTIRKDQRRGTTTVSIIWTDPAVAARWANGYVGLANQLIRNHAIEDANRNIAYLNSQIARSADVELRKATYNLMEQETKTLMLAEGRIDYAFELVDPAVAPELKAGPHRILATMIGLTLGLGAAGAAVFIWDSIARHRRRAAAARTSRES